MDVGHVISGAGHAGLIGWLLLGGVFQSDPLPFEVTDVSVISSDAFDAMMAAQRPPVQATEVAQPVQPTPEDVPTPAPRAETEVVQTPVPEVVEAPASEDVPQVPTPPAETQVEDTAPALPSPPEEVAVLVPEISDRPVPRPSERIAPEAVAPPDPEAVPDPIEQPAVREDLSGQTQAETQEATAPQEAATQIVTEAERPSAAPLASTRPPARRPSPLVQTAAPQTPPATATTNIDTQSAVNAALAEALGAGASTPATPTGPPLSAGEKDALRVAVSSCWNVGSLSSEALQTNVVVSVAMQQDGKPLTGSIRMTGFSGGSDTAARQAFEAARRAIVRCGARGFDLPIEKYGQWKDIEMTFNPERMRIK